MKKKLISLLIILTFCIESTGLNSVPYTLRPKPHTLRPMATLISSGMVTTPEPSITHTIEKVKSELSLEDSITTPQDMLTEQEVEIILHEIRGFSEIISLSLLALSWGGLDKKILDEFEEIFKKVRNFKDYATMRDLLSVIYGRFPKSRIERLKKQARAKVDAVFEYSDATFDREKILRQIDDVARVIRLHAGYYIGKAIIKKGHVKLNKVLAAYPAVKEKISRILTFDFQAGDITVYIDEIVIFQIMRNLLRNAVDATAPDKENRIILRTRLSEDKKYVFIEVEDHGIGVPREVLPKIFTPGFTTKAENEGKGLGLAIVKRLVKERCNGTISVESRHISEYPENHGTTFTVRLPVEKIGTDPVLPEKGPDKALRKKIPDPGSEGGLIKIIPPRILAKIRTMQIRGLDTETGKVKFRCHPIFAARLSDIISQNIKVNVRLNEKGRFIFDPSGKEEVEVANSIAYSVSLHELHHLFKNDQKKIRANPDETRADSLRGNRYLYVNIAAIIWYWFYVAAPAYPKEFIDTPISAVECFLDAFFMREGISFSFLGNDPDALPEISKLIKMFVIRYNEKSNQPAQGDELGKNILITTFKKVAALDKIEIKPEDIFEPILWDDKFDDVNGLSNEGGLKPILLSKMVLKIKPLLKSIFLGDNKKSLTIEFTQEVYLGIGEGLEYSPYRFKISPHENGDKAELEVFNQKGKKLASQVINYEETYTIARVLLEGVKENEPHWIVIDDSHISSEHCSIRISKKDNLAQILIENFSSTNGTIVSFQAKAPRKKVPVIKKAPNVSLKSQHNFPGPSGGLDLSPIRPQLKLYLEKLAKEKNLTAAKVLETIPSGILSEVCPTEQHKIAAAEQILEWLERFTHSPDIKSNRVRKSEADVKKNRKNRDRHHFSKMQTATPKPAPNHSLRSGTGQASEKVVSILSDDGKEFVFKLSDETRLSSNQVSLMAFLKEGDNEKQIGYALAFVSYDEKLGNRLVLKRGPEGREAIFVQPDYRKKYKGIGTSIMSMLFNFAHTKNIVRIELEEVSSDAGPFFEKIGFVPKTSDKRSYYFPVSEREMREEKLQLPIMAIKRRITPESERKRANKEPFFGPGTPHIDQPMDDVRRTKDGAAAGAVDERKTSQSESGKQGANKLDSPVRGNVQRNLRIQAELERLREMRQRHLEREAFLEEAVLIFHEADNRLLQAKRCFSENDYKGCREECEKAIGDEKDKKALLYLRNKANCQEDEFSNEYIQEECIRAIARGQELMRKIENTGVVEADDAKDERTMDDRGRMKDEAAAGVVTERDGATQMRQRQKAKTARRKTWQEIGRSKRKPAHLLKAERFKQRGKSLHEQGRHEDAVKAYKKALPKLPEKERIDALLNLSQLLLKLGRYDEAIRYAKKGLSTSHGTVEEGILWCILSHCYVGKKQYSNAIKTAENAVTTGEKNAHNRRHLAEALLESAHDINDPAKKKMILNQAHEEADRAIMDAMKWAPAKDKEKIITSCQTVKRIAYAKLEQLKTKLTKTAATPGIGMGAEAIVDKAVGSLAGEIGKRLLDTADEAIRQPAKDAEQLTAQDKDYRRPKVVDDSLRRHEAVIKISQAA